MWIWSIAQLFKFMVHLYKDSLHIYLAFWLRSCVVQRFIAVEVSQLFSGSVSNFMEFYFYSLSLSLPAPPQFSLALLIWVGWPSYRLPQFLNPKGNPGCTVLSLYMGFLQQIVNLQRARTLSAPGQPSPTGSRHPQLCHYYLPGVLHWSTLPSSPFMSAPISQVISHPSDSDLHMATLSIFWLYISLLLNFWNPSMVASQHPLYTSLLWIFSSPSCYTGDLVLPRTLVLLQVLAVFSPTLLV